MLLRGVVFYAVTCFYIAVLYRRSSNRGPRRLAIQSPNLFDLTKGRCRNCESFSSQSQTTKKRRSFFLHRAGVGRYPIMARGDGQSHTTAAADSAKIQGRTGFVAVNFRFLNGHKRVTRLGPSRQMPGNNSLWPGSQSMVTGQWSPS